MFDVLAHYDPSLPLKLAGDASYGIGAVISHTYPDRHECQIAFLFSKYWSMVQRHLYVSKFDVVTDHKPLVNQLDICSSSLTMMTYPTALKY